MCTAGDQRLTSSRIGTINATSWTGRTQRIVAGPLRQSQLLEHVAVKPIGHAKWVVPSKRSGRMVGRSPAERLVR